MTSTRTTGGTLNNWDNSFAFLLGNEPPGDHALAGHDQASPPIHNVALTQQQIQQNYAAGVGASYYLLFDVSALTNTPQSYIMFTASQYDNYSYLFYRADLHQPEFDLDADRHHPDRRASASARTARSCRSTRPTSR